MEQYEKSGPVPPVLEDMQDRDAHAQIRDLRAMIKAQDLEIDQLRREVRRLGSRLDTAVNAINGIRRG